MSRESKEDPIRCGVTVEVSPEHAFAVFTGGFGGWWPAAYTWSGSVLEAIEIEPRAGGRCFDRGPHGFECQWGRVLVWEPPRRLVFTWQISPERVPEPDPTKASEVEVRFDAQGPATTRVQLEHRGFERHGGGGAGYRAGMASAQGWAYLLHRYAAAAV